MNKMPTLPKKRAVNWRGVSLAALVALMLTVSYLGSREARTTSALPPATRVPLAGGAQPQTEPDGAAAAATDAPQASPSPGHSSALEAGEGFEAYGAQLAVARASAQALLDEVILSTDASLETVQEALRQKAELARTMEVEATIETLLRLRGFEDALCTVRSGSVNIVVRSQELTQQQAAQILDIAMAETGESAANVRIIPAE